MAAITGSELNPVTRAAAVAALRATTQANPIDILVIGGGVVGAGAAFDAASRGLTVGLLERRDYASGTSSRSSRLAHGGLRYLEQREFALVHEALTERGLLLERIAPHLVRPVPFILPVTRRWQVPYFGVGVELYDMLSRAGAYGGRMTRPKMLGREAARLVAPCLNPEVIDGAVTFHDAQIDDARHVLALVRSAADMGARVANSVEVTGFIRFGDRVVGVQAHDLVQGARFEVHARAVVSAAGVWTDGLRDLLGGEPQATVRQSKGVHLVVPRAAIRSSSAVITRTPASVLFLLPWGDRWIVGTTDTDFDGDPDNPDVSESDVTYLLEQANRWLLTPLSPADVIGSYAGLRPLVQQGLAEESSAKVSREHAVSRPVPGIVMITGGKYTTYRVMARDVIDAAIVERAAIIAAPVDACRTDQLPVIGAEGFSESWNGRAEVAAEYGLSVETVEFLLRRHGSHVGEVLSLGAADRALFEPLDADAPYLRAEVIHGVTHEGARTIEDVLLRRMRIGMEIPNRAESVVNPVADLMASALGWDADERAAAVADYSVPISK